MLFPAFTEMNFSAHDEQSLRRRTDDPNLAGVERDWGVDTAAECGCVGLRPIWWPEDECPSVQRRGLRLGMTWPRRRAETPIGLLPVFARRYRSAMTTGDLPMRTGGA